MQVKLISVTPDAFNLLLGTKTTRMRGKSPEEMTEAEKFEHWEYMLDTIESPFEFVDYIFEITGVSKNFTHQLVRTRTGAYQQETSRALDVSENEIVMPEAFQEDGALRALFEVAVADAQDAYSAMLKLGAQLQDARSIIPSNMSTAIKAKFNLRTLSETAKTRLCARTQGEYQNVFRLMRQLVVNEHPWAEPLLQPHCAATGSCKFPRWGGKVIGEAAKYRDATGKDDAPFTPIQSLEKANELEMDYRNEVVYDDVYQCPHYDPRMDHTELKRQVRLKFWSADEIAQANPVAKDGKSM